MTDHVTIVGGGLAAMAAAKELLERGIQVTILESGPRLGGKAGADRHGSEFDEHGWHLFPLWYLNIWSLVEELGIRSSFVDRTTYAYIAPGKYPNLVYLENPFSWRTTIHNLFHGVLPFYNSFLYQYVLLDLMSQPVRRRAQLDQVTVNGFARSRFYCVDSVVDQLEDTVSRASAIESYEMSAMTVRNVMRYWLAYHDPWFRILNGDLQSKFISPFEDHIRSLGAQVRTNTKVKTLRCIKGKVAELEVENFDSGVSKTLAVDKVLVTVPPEDVKALLSPGLVKLAPELSNIHYLRSRVMAGMTIYFDTKIPNIPAHHANFTGTKYELSMIDVTEVWGTKTTTICIVVSDYTTLQRHPPDEARDILLDELRRYLPFMNDHRIVRIDHQPHVAHPLFTNTAGAWPSRPKARTSIANLYFAGDYCQSHVDLTCMEGAVSTGLMAADAIRKDVGNQRPVTVRRPKTKRRAVLVLLKYLLLPGALVALAISIFITKRNKR